MLLKRSNQIFSALVQQGKAETQALISSYFNLAMYYRWFNKQDSVKMYVDTCLMLSERYNQKPIDRAYITAEIASMAKLPEEKEQALQQFETVKRIFEQQEQNPNASFKNKSFLAIVYFYLGNFYLQCHNYQLSVRYNQKALKTIEKYNWHRATKALILENLSKAQHQLGFYNKAYQNLSQAKHLGDALFSARSLRNSNLVNIKNKYEEKVSQQQAQLLQKEKELNHQRKSIFLFRIALISLLFSLAVFILIMLNKRQKSKFNEEKLQSEQLLEQKNKELTAFTLKLIEKEELVEQLTNELENLAQNNTQALSLVNSIKNGSKVLWDEFNTRFLEVNNGFYERLQTQYPNLSQTELKHCALIKLNFSSKEMAHLLGISPTSVHVSRHRIRKKMQLDREVNLSRFIAAI